MNISFGKIYRKKKGRKSNPFDTRSYPLFIIPTHIVHSQHDNMLHMVYYIEIETDKLRFMFRDEFESNYYLHSGYLK